MAFQDMSRPEIDRLLDTERLVRIGFEANGESYLVPLGFVWHQNALYAMTTRGRKTRMAAMNPRVSFQIDTSARTGPFIWHSVSGEGAFEVVTNSEELEAILPLLASRFSDMPDWMQAEYAAKPGDMICVRIQPSQLAGRKSGPP
jgi:nitroimidazol reductase NimA-like FMN-containing flavoprotein (pyridoxamine 5'-phosphate oxidase superfamily)